MLAPLRCGTARRLSLIIMQTQLTLRHRTARNELFGLWHRAARLGRHGGRTRCCRELRFWVTIGGVE